VEFRYKDGMDQTPIPNVPQNLTDRPCQSPGIEIVEGGGSIAEIQSPPSTTLSLELSLRPSGQLLSDIGYKEKEKYIKMWDVPVYRHTSPGSNLSLDFLRYFAKEMQVGDTLADFGCGTGRAAHMFLERGLNVNLIDIAPNCLDGEIQALTLMMPHRITFTEACLWELTSDIESADWLYCCDVMEHLPEAYVEQTLAQLAQRNKKGGCFQIFLQDEPFGTLIEDHLHLTIQNQEWWVEKISKHWDIIGYGPEIPGMRFSCFVAKKSG